MDAILSARPHKLHDVPPPGLAGIDYPDRRALADRMAQQDARIIFDSLRPLGDEFWNFIDGERTVADIAEDLCMQFNFELSPDLFVPIAEGLARSGYIRLEPPAMP